MTKLLLWIAGAFFALGPTAGVLISNYYWLSMGVSSVELRPHLPTSIWDGVFAAFVQGLIAEAIFFGIFYYFVLRLGRPALVSFLVVNALAAAYATMIYVHGVNPANYAGWGYLALPVVLLAPVVLSFILLVIWLRKLWMKQGNRIVKETR